MKWFKGLAALILVLSMVFGVLGVAYADDPVGDPTEEPTEEATVEPTEEPTVEPTEEPTVEPTEEPTVEPTEEPTVEPTEEPTAEPTEEPTVEPTEEATEEPTEEATEEPTEEATEEATATPTEEVTEEPTPLASYDGDVGASKLQTRTSTTYIQNMRDSAVHVIFTVYDSNGDEAITPSPPTYDPPARGRSTFAGAGLSAGFQGSAVAAAGHEVAIVTEIRGDSDGSISAYSGIQEVASTIYLPSVHWSGTSSMGWDCVIAIQNVSATADKVCLQIRTTSGVGVLPTTGGCTSGYELPTAAGVNLRPYASIYVNTTSLAAYISPYRDSYNTFAGSAVVTSETGANLAASVIETWKTNSWAITYNGLTANQAAAPGSTIYFPLMHRTTQGATVGTNGFNSFIWIQNVSETDSATVTIRWKNSNGTNAATASGTVGPLAMKYWSTIVSMPGSIGAVPPNVYGWYGTAEVSVSSTSLASVVGLAYDYRQMGAFTNSSSAEYYAGFRDADAHQYHYLPFAKKSSSSTTVPTGPCIGVLLQNVSATPASVSMAFYNVDGTLRRSISCSQFSSYVQGVSSCPMQPGGQMWIPSHGISNDSILPDGFNGSAIIWTANPAQRILSLIAIMDTKYFTMDQLGYYVAIGDDVAQTLP